MIVKILEVLDIEAIEVVNIIVFGKVVVDMLWLVLR